MPPPNPGKAASSTTIATHRKASPCTKPQHVLGSDDSQSRRSTMTDHLEQCDAALKKGLITQGDYDIVKASFIRMESLAMGLKTGLVASSELESIKVRQCDSKGVDFTQFRTGRPAYGLTFRDDRAGSLEPLD